MGEAFLGALVQSHGLSRGGSPVDERRPEPVVEHGRIDEEDAAGKERDDKRGNDPSDHVPESLAMGVVQSPGTHAVVHRKPRATCKTQTVQVAWAYFSCRFPDVHSLEQSLSLYWNLSAETSLS